MAVCKGKETKFYTGIKLAAIFAVMSALVACGDDSGSGSNNDSDSGQTSEAVEPTDSDIIADSFDDLSVCSGKREGVTAYVKDEKAAYVCEAGDWTPDKGTDKDSKSAENTSSSTSQAGTKSSSSEDDAPEGFVRENISVTGVAQKGPFKFGSPLNLYELKKDLKPSGLVYEDEISSNKGDFVIPKVSLVYPYAKLEVRGLYRNEVTGEWSTDSMTLRALTDFSEKRTEVNINLLTHLEYDRVLYLVQEKGYSVYAAKKQAAQEIMTAFEFATAVTYSEDFAIFQNEGVSATTSTGNATLLAISALVMGNRSDAEIQNVIDKFIADIRTDGEWNDLQTKADMADWAYNLDYGNIRASVKSWNILDIPDFETYLDAYWNNVYGLGGCSVNRKDIVAPNSNKLSKNLNKYFICDGSQWGAATTYQKDTYEWNAGKDGELKKGNVTDTIYVYNGSKWIVSERETSIGICGTKNAGVVSKFDGTYYICKNNAWGKATELEYDTYGWPAGSEGEVKSGGVNANNYYIYKENKWQVASNIEKDLNGCTTSREGVVGKSGNIHYICKSGSWTDATVLEYDTYGKVCNIDGSIVDGEIISTNKYVCDAGTFRVANEREISLDMGCVNYTENKEIRHQLTDTRDSIYTCKDRLWTGSVGKHIVFGSLTDSRDNKTYKTVVIGTQTWMAENLNYSDSTNYPSMLKRNRCYNNSLDSCTKYGRLYTWAAAMDSVGTFSTNGKGCGYGKICSPTYPVRGICPSGWHLPTQAEYNTLFTTVGGISKAGEILTTGWRSNNNSVDDFGFSALPAGFYYNGSFSGVGSSATFWTATEYVKQVTREGDIAIGCELLRSEEMAIFYLLSKDYGRSVRCLKDSP